MNSDMHHDQDASLPDASFADDRAEREWQAQERALADQRAGRATNEPQLHAYRLIARVASEPPSLQLPADFARRTAHAAVADALAQDARLNEDHLERNLLVVLIAAMGLGGIAVLLLFARTWLPAFGATAAVLGSPWPWALAVCLGLSGLSAHWQRQSLRR